jgi:hypothetical protein
MNDDLGAPLDPYAVMAETLGSESPSEVLLRGFLWVEWALDEFLEAHFEEYELAEEELRRFRFPQKDQLGGSVWRLHLG